MKIILAILLYFFSITNSEAYDIKMYGKEKYGYEQPKYAEEYQERDFRKVFRIMALADENYFPISSIEQGSVFNKVFQDLENATNIQISLNYFAGNYEEYVTNFERGDVLKLDGAQARFAVSYEEYPYSKNSYIYPAFFENKIHIIMAVNNKLNFKGKSNLKDYKGVYVKTEKLPKHLLKEFNGLGIKESASYDDALEKLLTGKIDYIAASYYPSLIEIYKRGCRNFVSYSTEPVWKVSLFLRGLPNLVRDKRLRVLKDYFKSPRYKRVRDEAFEELIDVYEKNTQGILPPKYIGYTANIEDEENREEEE